MSTSDNTKDLIISKAFDKWADKKWFQTCIAIFFFYLLLAPIAVPFIYNQINKQNTSIAVEETIEARETKKREAHQIAYEKSKQCYAVAKNTMKNYLTDIDCDYIFLIEYHNGTENVMNGIQFCRFDITLEATRESCPFISLEKFRDDIVARYDILLSEELSTSRGVLVYEENEFEKTDLYLAQHMKSMHAKQFAIVNILNEDRQVSSSLLCVTSKDESMNIGKIYLLQRELEILFKNTL